ncbi:MAG: carbohydrate ABC transporter permease [Clostridia bacterium]|nr:carbohydrate ABC transporter permease [Clostridia bacterium]
MSKSVKNGLWSVLFAAIGAFMLIPIYYLVVNTFKTMEEATFRPLGLPLNPTFENYTTALQSMNFLRALTNNLTILVFAVLFLVLFSSMAAYAIVKGKTICSKVMYSIFLIGLIIPFQVTIIPLYRIAVGFGMMNTLPGVIIINVFCINLSLSIFLFRGFINTIPAEMEEAAAIDGCGVFKTFWVIIFPLLSPIIATVGILDALAVWNDFMTPLLFLQSPEKNVLLQEVHKNVGPFSTNWTVFLPMLVLSVLPMVIIFLILQKHIIEGVVAGAVKG